MSKLLKASAALAICAASIDYAAAQSNVAIYGTIDGLVLSRQLAGEARVSRIDGGGMTTSRWGVRGTEDLGGGLAAFFDLSSHVRLDTGEPGRRPGDTAAGRFWSRYSFVGIRGSLGQLRLGRIATSSWIHALSMNALAESV